MTRRRTRPSRSQERAQMNRKPRSNALWGRGGKPVRIVAAGLLVTGGLVIGLASGNASPAGAADCPPLLPPTCNVISTVTSSLPTVPTVTLPGVTTTVDGSRHDYDDLRNARRHTTGRDDATRQCDLGRHERSTDLLVAHDRTPAGRQEMDRDAPHAVRKRDAKRTPRQIGTPIRRRPLRRTAGSEPLPAADRTASEVGTLRPHLTTHGG